jgi:DNA repair exonuclease SbcCD ATPase subunit
VKKEAKLKAKKDMLKKLKGMMKEDMLSPFGDSEKKPEKKITIMADSEEGLKEGLSMAEKIMKKKKLMEEGEEYDDDDESCPICGKEHEGKYGCGGTVHKK